MAKTILSFKYTVMDTELAGTVQELQWASPEKM